MIVPALELKEASVKEILTFLQKKSEELDSTKTGFRIVLELPEDSESSILKVRMTLSLTYIPMLEALKYIAALGDLKFRIHRDSVIFAASSDASTFHKFYDVTDWQRKATSRYPDLAVAGSPVHVAFMREYRRHKEANPAFFAAPDWPMVLAAQVTYNMRELRPSVPEPADPLEFAPPASKANQQGLAAAPGSLRPIHSPTHISISGNDRHD